MRCSPLLLTALLSCALLTARAQAPRGAAYYLRHPAATDVRPGLLAPALAAAHRVAPLPTTAAAALTPAFPDSPALAAALPPAPRRDVGGVQPLYDLYGKLPEDFRRHTLPAAYIEPLPVQLLRGLLGR